MPKKTSVSSRSNSDDSKNQHFCVKFNNYLNTIPLQHFTAQDYDIFMTICAKIKGCGTDKVIIAFKEMREMTNFRESETEELVRAFKQVFKKMAGIVCNIDSDQYSMGFTLFNAYGISRKEKKIVIAANENFAFILNRFLDGFTWFELNDFVNLRSKYDKALYRLLCQYRSTGMYIVKIDTFRQLMGFPATMPNKKMMQQIKSSISALSELLPDLACETVKGDSRGNAIQLLKFTFRKSKAQPEQDVLTVAPELMDAKNKPDGLTINQLAELAELKSQAMEDHSKDNVGSSFMDCDFDELEDEEAYEALINSDTL